MENIWTKIDELQRRLNNLRPSEALPVGDTPELEYGEGETVPEPELTPSFQPENDHPVEDVEDFLGLGSTKAQRITMRRISPFLARDGPIHARR